MVTLPQTTAITLSLYPWGQTAWHQCSCILLRVHGQAVYDASLTANSWPAHRPARAAGWLYSLTSTTPLCLMAQHQLPAWPPSLLADAPLPTHCWPSHRPARAARCPAPKSRLHQCAWLQSTSRASLAVNYANLLCDYINPLPGPRADHRRPVGAAPNHASEAAHRPGRLPTCAAATKLPRAALAARQMQPVDKQCLHPGAALPALTPWDDPTTRHRLPHSPVLARWRKCIPHTRDHPGLSRPCAIGQPCVGI